MHVIFFMIGLSLTLAVGFLVAFFWSLRSGQIDDLYTPSMRILLDDDANTTEMNEPNQSLS